MTKMATAGTPYRHQLGKSAEERICIPDLALSEWFHSTVNSGSCRRNTKLSNGTSLASDGSLTRSYPGYFSQKSPRVVTPNIGAIVDIMDESRNPRLKNVPIID
ncbi:hypothetical protein BgiBS90_033890 [Biomphalaria glabrata]|nr:hypothetical protein BgiBS90_033890 [Biomphalaria glabrata]